MEETAMQDPAGLDCVLKRVGPTPARHALSTVMRQALPFGAPCAAGMH